MSIPNVPDPAAPGSPEHSADPQIAAPGTTPAPPQWESDENPYKQRFNDYRSEADRRATELAQFQQAKAGLLSDDPETRRTAADFLGIELDEPDPPSYDDPYDELTARYDDLAKRYEALEARFGEVDQRRAADLAEQAVEAKFAELGIADAAEQDFVLAQAVRMAPTQEGLPDIEAALEAIVARDQRRDQANGASYKQTKLAPGQVANGATATQTKNVADMVGANGLLTQEGLDYLAQQAEIRATG